MTQQQRRKITEARTYAELEDAINDIAIQPIDAEKVAAFLRGEKSLNELRAEIGMTTRSQFSGM